MDGQNLAVDAAALAVYAVVANPAVHGHRRCTSGWAWACSWFSSCTRPCTPTGWPTPCVRLSPGPRWRARATWCSTRFRSSPSWRARCRASWCRATVLRAFGLYAEGYYFWDPLHAVSAKVLLALLVVHVAVHAKWIAAWFRKGKAGRPGGREEA